MRFTRVQWGLNGALYVMRGADREGFAAVNVVDQFTPLSAECGPQQFCDSQRNPKTAQSQRVAYCHPPCEGAEATMAYSVRVNGETREVDVDGDTPMLWVLRDVCGLTGTKYGCGIAMCGACTIHVDGQARRACFTPVSTVGAAHVQTIETLHDSAVGQALQKAWRELDVVQCGYCQSGQLMSAAALLAANRNPTDADIDMIMSGNICRCGTYGRIRAGIQLAAKYLAGSST